MYIVKKHRQSYKKQASTTMFGHFGIIFQVFSKNNKLTKPFALKKDFVLFVKTISIGFANPKFTSIAFLVLKYSKNNLQRIFKIVLKLKTLAETIITNLKKSSRKLKLLIYINIIL